MSTKSSKESFVSALELLEKEKGIPKEYLLEKIETALVSAYHKEYGANANVRIELNLEKDDIRVYQQMTVVETVTDPETEISEEDAKAINKRYRVGQEIEIRVEPKNFRRLSAKAATSVIVQSIREGERMVRQEAYGAAWRFLQKYGVCVMTWPMEQAGCCVCAATVTPR